MANNHHGHFPHPDEAKNADGSYDLDKAEAALDGVKAAHRSGKMTLQHMDSKTVGNTVVFTSVSTLNS